MCNLVLNYDYEKACYSRVYEKSMLIYVLPVTICQSNSMNLARLSKHKEFKPFTVLTQVLTH